MTRLRIRNWLIGMLIFVLVAIIILLALNGHWLYVHLGIAGSGPYYGWWSGFGSDIGEVVIIGGLISIYRRHSCHAKGCWRVGLHAVDGTPFVTCHKHHPVLRGQSATAEDIAQRHADAQAIAGQDATEIRTKLDQLLEMQAKRTRSTPTKSS